MSLFAEPFKILETLEASASNGIFDIALIDQVCKYLKVNGKCLDDSNAKDTMDLYFITLRNISRDIRLDAASRAKLLKIIELRATNWCASTSASNGHSHPDKQTDYSAPTNTSIKQKQTSQSFTFNDSCLPACHLNSANNQSASDLTAKPLTKTPSKSFIKDEVVIRNADSGKGKSTSIYLLPSILIAISWFRSKFLCKSIISNGHQRKTRTYNRGNERHRYFISKRSLFIFYLLIRSIAYLEIFIELTDNFRERLTGDEILYMHMNDFTY